MKEASLKRTLKSIIMHVTIKLIYYLGIFGLPHRDFTDNSLIFVACCLHVSYQNKNEFYFQF